ncbi:hypothetical protein B0H67DRAFT_585669 [Lasiosphaeris hirsuta]|uniref:Uncharacterized protein n=1 Tax=Lasiosphaeris hirsuta TaxID=260670 RepID=A0AA40A971_9PEZI|nr:hypothetical protein B0H67DRAFT_585669 [Lasiosphaeris hirsuta]
MEDPYTWVGRGIIKQRVEEALKTTDVACRKLEAIKDGETTNFIYKGTLLAPLEDCFVYIKHGRGYSACDPALRMPMFRCDLEAECLTTLENFPLETIPSVRTPRLEYFDPEKSIQVQEFMADPTDLKTYAHKHFTFDPDRMPWCEELGRKLGAWLRRFHAWAMEPPQQEFREKVLGF